MALSSTGTYVHTPKCTPQSFVNADGTTKKTAVTAGADATKVVALTAASTDTTARVLNIWLTRSATSYLLHSQSVTVASGSDGIVPPQNLLANWPGLPVDNDGQPYFYLESGDTLQVSAAVAVTAAKEIDVFAVFGNF